jgi:exodeoxyribonuclease VII large subunit
VAALTARPVFTDPASVLGPAWQALDMARVRLERALPERLARDAERVRNARMRLAGVGPRVTQSAETRIALGAARLDDLSPLAILRRGYAAAFAEDGHTVVRSITQVSEGDRVVVRVSDGRLECTVDGTEDGGTDGR